MSLASEQIEQQHLENETIRHRCRQLYRTGKRANPYPTGTRARRIWADEADRIMQIMRESGVKATLHYLKTGKHEQSV